uniref:Protein Vpu n=1 Tax=Human immunodeficiency virus type 1 TaxID=11676 RepID=A0A0M4AM19_HV1|nr:vpu protein [Human immunodeficiency virus 1]
MSPLVICSIIGLVVALILVIVVWIIVIIECRKLQKQKRIDRLLERIGQRAEDSGNESDGDTEELSTLIDMGNYNLGFDNNL